MTSHEQWIEDLEAITTDPAVPTCHQRKFGGANLNTEKEVTVTDIVACLPKK